MMSQIASTERWCSCRLVVHSSMMIFRAAADSATPDSYTAIDHRIECADLRFMPRENEVDTGSAHFARPSHAAMASSRRVAVVIIPSSRQPRAASLASCAKSSPSATTTL